jgi:hypothetical protein
MSQRHPLAIVAGAATVLSAFPLVTVFASITWLFYTVFAVAAVVGTAMGVRTARGPLWAQFLAMTAGLLACLTLLFPSGEELFRIIPTESTFRHFHELLVAAGQQMRDEAPPVPDREGLLLLTTVGVGMVAVLVDLAAVGLRRPALAGLPMLAIYSVPVAVLPEGLSVLPFGIAAAGYLWLLLSDSVDRVRRFGRRFTGEGRDVDVWEPSPLASTGRRLGLAGIVIAALLPLVVPGVTSGLIDRFGRGGGGSGGGRGAAGVAVDLTALLRDKLVQESQIAMVRVSTGDPSPYYLRFGVADQVTDEGFANRAPAGGTPISAGLPKPVVPSGVASQRYKASVETVDFDMHLVPVYQQVVGTQGLEGAWLMDASTSQIFSGGSGPSITGRRYEFDFVRVAYTPAALRTAGPIQSQDMGARELTNIPPVQQVTTLVATLTAGKATEYDKVRAIYDYLSPANGFTYSLATVGGTDGPAIADFLASRKGFCVQYAAAMAWLVRAAGFPARVAFGFSRGGGPSNGVYTLTNHNLHAWTEVFFPGFGWVPFDATPAGAVTGSVQSAWAPDTTNPTPPDGGGAPELPGDPSAGPSGEPAPISTDPGSGTNPGAGPAPINMWWLAGAAAAAFALIMALLPALSRRSVRRRRRSRGASVIVLGDGAPTQGPPPPILDAAILDPAILDPAILDAAILDAAILDAAGIATARRDAHAAWAELIDTMVDFGIPVDDAETPRATAERLCGLLQPPAARESPAGREPLSGREPSAAWKPLAMAPVGLASAPVGLLASAEERARYARTPLPAPGLNEAVESTRAALARRGTRWQRVHASLMPRSVILRWRAAWIGWVGRTVGAAGRIRDAVLTISPRRLLTPREPGP